MLYIVYRTFISMANDKELIRVKNWANIIDHLKRLIVTKYASQNSTKGHLCHLSNTFKDKMIIILEYSLSWDAKKHICKTWEILRRTSGKSFENFLRKFSIFEKNFKNIFWKTQLFLKNY